MKLEEEADWKLLAVWIRYLLYWGMPLDLVMDEGSVGDILSYVTREVPGETGSLGQNKLKRSVLSQQCNCVRRLSWFRN